MGNKSIKLTKEQILSVQSSDKDIEAGRLISLKQLDSEDRTWLSEEQKNELDKRLNEYQNGTGKTYTWNETIAMAKQALAEQKNKRK